MKKKRPAHSKDQPSIKKKQQHNSDSELVHEFIESISDRIDDFKNIMELSDFSTSKSDNSKTNLDNFDSFFKNLSEDISDSSTPKSDKKKANLNNLESFFEQFSMDESMERASNKEGFLSFKIAAEEKTFDYAEEEPENKYRFQFTNSELLAFFASLDPLEYLIVITLFAILIYVNFNSTELQIIYGLFNNIGDTIETIVEQEVLQEELKEEIATREKKQALQDDLTYLNNQIIQLNEKIQQLEAKLDDS